MVNNILIDSVNEGLTKLLKDIASTYNLDAAELCDRYVSKQDTKKQKRIGHVSTYNMFLREHRTTLTDANPEMTFPEIARAVGVAWKGLSDTDKKKLESRRDEYILAKKNVAVDAEIVPAQADVPTKQKSKSTKSKSKSKAKAK